MKALEKKIHTHMKERGWENHRPVDVAKSIMIEGAELLEIFQWDNLSLDEVRKNKEKMVEIQKELADVFIYALEMSVILKLDTDKIVREKLAHVAKKYPAKVMKDIKKNPGTESEYWRIKKEYRKKGL